MGAINWDFAVKATPVNPANFMVAAVYNASSGAFVASIQLPKPYTGTSVGTFLGLDPIVYNYILWESVDASPAGSVLIPSFKFEPATATGLTLRNNLDLIGGITAGFATGGTGYIDPTNSLIGWSYTVFEIGDGPKQQVQITYDADNNWALNNGETIQDGQKFVMVFQPQGTLATPAVPSLISAGVTLTTDTTLDNSYVNKAIFLQGGAASFIITLPSLGTISDWQVLYFFSAGGTHINVSIRCNGTDKIQRKTQISKIVLAQNETLKLFKANGVWNVDGDLPGVDNVLRLIESCFATELNAHAFDGTTSLRSSYERVWDMVNANPAMLIAEASWTAVDGSGKAINKGYFSPGDGSTTFRWPNLATYGYRRVRVAGAGTYLPEQIGPHTHEQTVSTAIANGGRKPAGFLNTVSDEGGSGHFTLENGGTENTPPSTAIFLYGRI